MFGYMFQRENDNNSHNVDDQSVREDLTDSVTDRDETGPLQDLIASLEQSLEEARVSGRNDVEQDGENYWKDKSQKETGSPKFQKSSKSGEVKQNLRNEH